MKRVTKFLIAICVDGTNSIEDAVKGLPKYCSSSFQNCDGDWWSGEFNVSCPVAPKLADGDFVDDLSPYFPELLRLKQFYDASFALEIAVGHPGSKTFELAAHSVALLAALGASIEVFDNLALSGAEI